MQRTRINRGRRDEQLRRGAVVDCGRNLVDDFLRMVDGGLEVKVIVGDVGRQVKVVVVDVF